MTPRPYLSWSQMQLLERSPEKYREVYIEGKPSFTNAAMGFGSKVGKYLEDDDLSGDAAIDLVLSQMPRLQIPEYEIHAILPNGKQPVPLIAKLDSAQKDLSRVFEYKTGMTKWTQTKADAAGQLTFYATVIYLITKKLPDLELIWAQTEREEGSAVITFTGEIKRFKTQRHMGEIIRMMQRMRDAQETIQKMTEEALI